MRAGAGEGVDVDMVETALAREDRRVRSCSTVQGRAALTPALGTAAAAAPLAWGHLSERPDTDQGLRPVVHFSRYSDAELALLCHKS